MVSAELQRYISEEEYLTGELVSEVKHEYIDGEVYAMAGASRAHSKISISLCIALGSRLKGGHCEVYANDVKSRLMLRGKDIYYYPDIMVGGDPRDSDPYSLRFPKLIIEIMSPATNRIDKTEKLLNYTTIPSLAEYLLVDQDQTQVILHRRRTDWTAEVTIGLDSSIHLESVELILPLSQLYEDIAGIA